jgi:tetratricopeptide (TPR) repeat protein
MMSGKIAHTFLLAFLLVGACFMAQSEENHGRERLNSCISLYKDGDYQKAADSLQVLVPLLAKPEDQMEAYKYLGFSYGMLNWIDKSKAAFKTVLKKYSAMDIDTLEVPPNIAIIFKQAKLERRLETIDTTKTVKTYLIVQRKNIVLPTVLLSVAIISAGAGGNLLYYGNQQYQTYKSVNTPDQKVLDKYFTNALYAYIGGAACEVVTCVLVPVSLYLYFKKEPRQYKMGISIVNGVPSLACTF